MHARDIMTTRVMTVQPETTVAHAADILTDHGYTALPVVDSQGELVGIITEADLLRSRFPTSTQMHPALTHRSIATVAEAMTSPIIGVNQDADIAVVVKEMLLHRRRCVPIIDGAKLVGVITRRDVVRLLARSDQDIANDVCKHLVYLGGHVRWQVTVVDGEATLGDRYEDATDRFVAVALAEAVPGVLRATAVSSRPATDTAAHGASTSSRSSR